MSKQREGGFATEIDTTQYNTLECVTQYDEEKKQWITKVPDFLLIRLTYKWDTLNSQLMYLRKSIRSLTKVIASETSLAKMTKEEIKDINKKLNDLIIDLEK